MVFDRDPKLQDDAIPVSDTLDGGVIVSPDTRRADRIPPGQSRTKKWPVLDASGTPDVDSESWTLQVDGLVNRTLTLNLAAAQHLPRVRVFADFHCVTRWSRLGNLWEGISTRELIGHAGGLQPEARFVLAHGLDSGWTTNVPVEEFLADDALIAFTHDGEPISADHGGPVRLVLPRLYAWKSAKWLTRLEFLSEDRAGFWERNGYHMHGDPWREQRYGW